LVYNPKIKVNKNIGRRDKNSDKLRSK